MTDPKHEPQDASASKQDGNDLADKLAAMILREKRDSEGRHPALILLAPDRDAALREAMKAMTRDMSAPRGRTMMFMGIPVEVDETLPEGEWLLLTPAEADERDREQQKRRRLQQLSDALCGPAKFYEKMTAESAADFLAPAVEKHIAEKRTTGRLEAEADAERNARLHEALRRFREALQVAGGKPQSEAPEVQAPDIWDQILDRSKRAAASRSSNADEET